MGSQLDAMKEDNTNTNGLSSGGISLLHFMDVFSKSRLLFPLTLAAIIISSMSIWQKNCKFFQSTQVDGGNVQVFKDLKITMDKYALHSEF